MPRASRPPLSRSQDFYRAGWLHCSGLGFLQRQTVSSKRHPRNGRGLAKQCVRRDGRWRCVPCASLVGSLLDEGTVLLLVLTLDRPCRPRNPQWSLPRRRRSISRGLLGGRFGLWAAHLRNDEASRPCSIPPFLDSSNQAIRRVLPPAQCGSMGSLVGCVGFNLSAIVCSLTGLSPAPPIYAWLGTIISPNSTCATLQVRGF